MKYHFCRVFVEKKNIYRILNLCSDMVLKNVRQIDEKVSFEVDYNHIKKLMLLLEQENISIVEIEELGVRKRITFSTIKIICCSLILVIGILWVNSLYIWEISVEGNYTYTKEQIKEFVNENNLYEGMRKSAVDCSSVENMIRNKFTDISWVSCEMKGTNLIIHLKENYISAISAKETKPYNLIANVSGKIVSIITRNGRAVIKAGNKVKKGDLLISGMVEIKNESDEIIGNRYCRADGDIMAKVVHKYNDTINIKQIHINPKNRKTYYIPLVERFFFDFSGFDSPYIEKSNERICLYGDYYLPFKIYKYVVYQDEPKEIELTKEKAEEILNHKMLYYFAQLEQKGYKILKKDVKIVKAKNQYSIDGSFTCIEPIGKVEYISIEDVEKESSTK